MRFTPFTAFTVHRKWVNRVNRVNGSRSVSNRASTINRRPAVVDTCSATSAWWQSSATDEWPTPQATFDALEAEFGFTLDPCATPESAKCARYFTKEDDGLKQTWVGEQVFMNPPYGRQIGVWIRKAFEAAAQGSTVVGLVPARPDTCWWHDYIVNAAEVRFVKGRLRFGDGPYPAPFPSAIVVWTPLSVTARCNCGRALRGRSDSRYCSSACRQRAYRRRKA
jgi:phage N-6-adenine-methyltransferase